uniref:ATP-binding protein n=1 Tax=Cyanothece sp. BG0011 TaxID=2082950 RepID=UPI000D1EBF6D
NEAINLLKQYPNVKLDTLESPEQALFHLLSGDVDGLAYPEPPIRHLVQSISLDYRLKTIEPVLKEIPRAIAVRSDRSELLQRLNPAVKAFLQSSDYEEIYQRWYQPTPLITLSPMMLKGLGGLVFLIAMVIFLWRLSLMRSMSRLRQTQMALKESEAQYRGIVEDQTELICRFLPDGTLTFVNQAYCRYFEQSYHDIINRRFIPFIPEEYHQSLQDNLSRLSRANPVMSHEHPVINGQGDIRWQYWVNRGLFDEGGNLVEIQGVGRDISEQKCIEQELAKNLQQSQTLNNIIKQIHQTLDIESILKNATEETRKILQSDRVAVYQFNADWSGEFIAESVDEKWVKLVNSDVKKVWEDTYLQKTQGGRYKNNQTFRVDNIYTVGHQQCHIDLLEQFQAKAYMIVPLFVHHQLWGLLACYQNSHPRHWNSSELQLLTKISHQLALAIQQSELLKQLETAKNSAEAANEAKSNFLAHMSHELRTPLNAILGFSQLLNNDYNLNDEQKEYIGIINQSGEHLLTIIKNILDMAKIEARQVSLHYQSFNLYQLLRNISQMFKLKAQSKGIDLIIEIGQNVPSFIVSDQAKLRQILINLLNNSLKFTEEGKVILRILNSQKVPQEKGGKIALTFEIEDTGIGIDLKDFDHLFEPFFQTKVGQKSQEGTGLGLSISKEFVDLMGGKLQVSSQVNQGTTFYFTLSVEIPKSSDTVKVSSPDKIVGLAPHQPSYRILIIEDDFANRKVLINLLKSVGFVVQEANNGEEGVKLWETWQPDLIWMDLEMPVMDGYQATRTIRTKNKELDGTKTPKIIALTASVFAENREAVLNIGCDDFVSKPVAESTIFEKLAEHLGVRYIYSNSLTTPVAQQRTPFQLKQLKTQLETLSIAWRNQLYQKAAAADGELILQLLDELPSEYRDLRQGIVDLVENYSFDQIMEISQ